MYPSPVQLRNTITMIAYLILGILATLPLSTTATPAPTPPQGHPKGWKAPIDPLDISTYNGDVLNVTKCYCEDPNDAIRKGFYYQYDYYNFHQNTFWSANKVCDSHGHNRALGLGWEPDCWGNGAFKEFHVHSCMFVKNQKSKYGRDSFCYQLQGIRMVDQNWTVGDYYYFNQQKRGIASMRSWKILDGNVCRDHCSAQIPGMVMAEDREGGLALTVRGLDDHYVLENSYSSYTDCDDMCNGCRK